jgi:hypothetical protein
LGPLAASWRGYQRWVPGLGFLTMCPAPMESDLPAELKEHAPDDSASGQLILSPEQRQQYLGKLAEFQLRLEELPEMQANFVLAVLKDPSNFEAAARVAGYKHAGVLANRLKQKPQIAAAIALGEQLREDRTFLTSDRTLHEFAIIAFSDITDFTVGPGGRVTVREGVPEYMTRAISSVKWDVTTWTEDDETHTRVKTEIKLWNKNDALKMLAMYQKLLSGENGINIVNDNSKHVHVHQHQHNTWQVGDQRLTF